MSGIAALEGGALRRVLCVAWEKFWVLAARFDSRQTGWPATSGGYFMKDEFEKMSSESTDTSSIGVEAFSSNKISSTASSNDDKKYPDELQ